MDAEKAEELARKSFAEKYLEFTGDKNVMGKATSVDGKVQLSGAKTRFNSDDGVSYKSDLTYHDFAFTTPDEANSSQNKGNQDPQAKKSERDLQPFVSGHGGISEGGGSSILERTMYQEFDKFKKQEKQEGENDSKRKEEEEKGIKYRGVYKITTKEIFENRTLISEPHQYMLVEMLISKLLEDEKGFLKPRNEIYFKFIKSVFNTLKQSNISGEDVKGFAKECIENILPREKEYGRANGKGLTKKGEDHKKKIEDFTRQITLLYNGYQAEMEVQKKFDFNDLINETVLLLKQKQDILQSLQEKYQYILVDEFQDTNLKQREVLECLVTGNDQPNLFVVGDDDQCIYKFQGASSANFKWVKDRFKNLETIELGINYRSTTTILNETHNLISNNSDRQPKKKTAIN